MLKKMLTKAQHAKGYARIPALLRTLREDAGLTQREIGKRLRRPQSWVYNCESGNRRVDLAEFCEWCRACQVDPTAGLRRFLRGD
jgi:transcriptional regulator with XRE-family HTH domain